MEDGDFDRAVAQLLRDVIIKTMALSYAAAEGGPAARHMRTLIIALAGATASLLAPLPNEARIMFDAKLKQYLDEIYAQAPILRPSQGAA